jgi:pyridoxine 5-phosphate synthase
MALLFVKVDAVASLRAARKHKLPDPCHAAVLAELAGADGIACHLREDRLHIRDRDFYILKEVVKSRLNLQIAPDDDLVERGLEVKPRMVTLMPFTQDETVISKGIDTKADGELCTDVTSRLKEAEMAVAWFIEPDSEAIKDAARAKVDAVELNAHEYVTAASDEQVKDELEALEHMAELAGKLGMAVGCGNGLDYGNIRPLVELDVFDRFTVGFSIVSRAIMVGLEGAVREMGGIVHRSVE